jgi:hypothetical protein
VAGLINPLYGTYASHGYFSGLPGDTQIISTQGELPGGDPTLIEYPLGAGKAVLSAQTLEIAWVYGWSGGHILDNMPLYLAAQPWAQSAPWALTPGDGMKTVYGEFRNGAGLWSAVYTDTIILDTQLPSSSASSPAYDNGGEILVAWTSADAGPSGLSSTALWYRLDSGPWTDSLLTQAGASGSFSFPPPGGTNGRYSFATVAADQAGNSEPPPSGDGDTATVYDTQAPSAAATCLPQASELFFDVNWNGSDALSGVATYDIQYRLGSGGAWTDWTGLIGTTQTSATFGPTSPVTVERDQTYYFRSRAHDNAGNVSSYAPTGDCSTYVELLHLYLPHALRNSSQ